ncbi:metallophosphoesterase [Nakamurella flava]|uniref:Phosphoesterase n=1 Tax=Nakamurella flava TaxID=2576308 RepID=A0A4U6QP47_9ACTN|nr:metallophosphoesterase [Nakamurella flava]TKV61832.1 metallophosphoesterase [Nakamurella flava]
MHVLLLSDTHVPKRARELPGGLWADIEAADVVVHAGDWVVPALLDEIQERSRRLIGVAGNNDGTELHERLGEVATMTLGGLRFAVVHETGAKQGREARMDRAFPDADVVVFGHSHIPWDTRTPQGRRLLNPGSPTDRRRQPVGTYLTLTVADGRIEDLVWHEIPPRPAAGDPTGTGPG